MAKYCGKCGSQIQPNLEICPFCGDDLKSQIPSNVYTQDITISQESPEFAPVEITDTGKKTFICLMVAILCPIVFVISSLSSFLLSAGYLLELFIYVILPIVVICGPIIYYTYRLYTQTSKIIISKTGIEFIQFPKRHSLKVNWSDFDTIKLKVTGTRSFPDSTFTSSRPLTRNLKIRFLREHPSFYQTGTKFKIFSDLKVNEILNQIKSYARKMNKTVLSSRRTTKYYSKY